MIGFKIIGKMSRDELIEEMLMHQRAMAQQQTTDALKQLIISMRMTEVHDRMIKEAELEPSTVWGLLHGNTDDAT